MEQLSDIKKYARKNAIPIMRDGGIDFICDYIVTHNIKRILEIGTAIGYSSIRFANLDNDISVSTIEYDIERYQQAVRNVYDCDLMDRITLYLGDALSVNISGEFDLIFIDAAKAQYIKYFERFKHFLAPNGVIIADNLSFHGMVDNPNLTDNYSTKKLVHKLKRFKDFLIINEEFKTEFLDIGDGIAVSHLNTEPKKDIFEILMDIGIYYELQIHKPIFNEKDAKDVALSIPGVEVKNLFVKDKHGVMALVSLPLHKRADLKQIANILKSKRLSFCDPNELKDYLHITPGSVTPLCIMYDKLLKVHFIIDKELSKQNVLIHPLRNDATISISFEDLIKFTNYFKHPYFLEELINKGE